MYIAWTVDGLGSGSLAPTWKRLRQFDLRIVSWKCFKAFRSGVGEMNVTNSVKIFLPETSIFGVWKLVLTPVT